MIRQVCSVPLYKKVKSDIAKSIINKDWVVGQIIPSEKQLGKKYNISRLTVRKSLGELIYEGLIYSVQGKGHFVKSNTIESNSVNPSYTIGVSIHRQNLIQEHEIPGSWFTNGISNGLMKGCYHHRTMIDFMELQDLDRSKITSILEKIDGFIWLDPEGKDRAIIKNISESIPVLVINRSFPGSQINYIDIDNYCGPRIVTEYLIDLGHIRIGCISGKRTLKYANERWRGYVDAHNEKRVNVDLNLTIEINNPFEDFSLQLDELFGRKCTAVFIAGGNVIRPTLEYFYEKRINIPSDISVVGFDEVPLPNNLSPIMTVKQPLEELGITAVNTLFKILNKEISKPVEMIMDTEIIKRDSCKRLR